MNVIEDLKALRKKVIDIQYDDMDANKKLDLLIDVVEDLLYELIHEEERKSYYA